ncbi:polysaccharide biosynthesis protein [Alicyclobacillus sacchari]|uniref:Polysaccharide biosynthesis protein n=1 Tax=Alicyclobacillus sacchari TaxID=392010 RepID=A0A4R8LGA7_9BACL|nr:polysaccharide biosynthesis protein [Alicyclobacillus sacchari]TDY42162.1 polysaccharide biosynthesis protein [Alicyclobacillus sacchari]GMA58952.1 UDP-N-acetylglucosamine 4,6-dehydratase [Alicyclobacillus sacchari]
MFEGQTVVITGGTGSWGKQLTRTLLTYRPQAIRILSRNEFSQVEMERAFADTDHLQFFIGDVRDPDAVRKVCAGADYVFHLAALKHVPVCERHPREAMKTNILGTQNVIQASIECGVKKVIDVSTDKAVEPINLYGMTKALGEKLMLQANAANHHTRFVCIRGGNVLGSNGSVVPLFVRQIQTGRPITLTSRDMTRFFLTIEDAIDLLIHATALSVGGETFVMRMKSCRMIDLACVIAEYYGQQTPVIEEIGIRPGEKLHEVLVSRQEAPRTQRLDDRYFVVLPMEPSTALLDKYGHLDPLAMPSYESNMQLLSREGIRALLQRGGFLP